MVLLKYFSLLFILLPVINCDLTNSSDNSDNKPNDEFIVLIEVEWVEKSYGDYTQHPMIMAVVNRNVLSGELDSLNDSDVEKYVTLTPKPVGEKDTVEVLLPFRSSREWYLFYIFYDENENDMLDEGEQGSGWFKGWLFAEDRKNVYNIKACGI